jgi:hypothetical protein
MRAVLRFLTAVAIFGLSPAFASEALAQMAIMPNISWLKISADNHPGRGMAHFVDEETPGVGIRGNYLWGTVGRIEASYSYSRSAVTTRLLSVEEEIGAQAFSSAKMSVHLIRLGLVRDLIGDDRGRSFYYSVGGGIAILDPSRGLLSFDPSELENDSKVETELSTVVDPLVALSTGVRWPVGQKATLRLELQDDLQFCNAEDVDVLHYLCPAGGIKQHLNFTLGVEIPL